MKRTISGIIKNPINDASIPNADILIEFVSGSYISSSFYTPILTTVKTDLQGRFSIDLWCNETGDKTSFYFITIPGYPQPLKFIVPEGTTEIPLTTLIEEPVNPIEPQHQSLISYIQSQITTATERETFIITNLQKQTGQIVLAKTPSQPHLTQVVLNGIQQLYSIDFNVNQNIINWTSTVPLEVGWYMQIFYN